MKGLLKASALSLVAALMLGMSGCSSDSSTTSNVDDTSTTDTTDTTATDDTTDTATADTTVSGKAIDGYLIYATVCLDLNKDGYCQIGDEPAASTDTNGSFSLSISQTQKESDNYDTAPLLVYSGYDADTGNDFIGKLKAPFDESGVINITPITTMVHSMVEANQTLEEAEASVATMLGLPEGTDLGADPIVAAQTDTALLSASLQLQKSLEVLADALEASGNATDSKNDLMEGLYVSLAQQVSTTADANLTAALGGVVENHEDLDSVALESATTVVTQVEEIIASDTDGVVDTAVVSTKISAVQEEIVINVIDNNGTLEDLEALDLETIVAKPFSLLHAEEILRIVEYTESDFDELALKVQATLVGAGMNESEFLPVEDEITALKGSSDEAVVSVGELFEARMNTHEQDAEDIDTLVEETNNINDAEGTVDELIGDSPDGNTTEDTADTNTSTTDENATTDENTTSEVIATEDEVNSLIATESLADVDDAKYLVAQLREAVYSLVDIDAEKVEDNTSTVLGSQVDLITTKIQPAAEDIVNDFNASVSNLDDSVTAFVESLSPNFVSVFGDENTTGTLQARIDAINAVIPDTNETNWSVTAGEDSLEYTYMKATDSDTVTETFTFNGQTITAVTEQPVDADLSFVSVNTTGAITLSGDGYDLNVSSLDFSDNVATLVASGTITGTNSSTIEMKASTISFGLDESQIDSLHFFTNVELEIEGTVISSGRTFNGTLVLSENDDTKNKLSGSYIGANGEPSFSGELILNTSLYDTMTVLDEKRDYVDPNTLLMVTYDDGNSSFVTSYSRTYNYDTYSYSYILNTQDSNTLECTVTSGWAGSIYSNTVACDGGSVQAYYGEDKEITLRIDGVDYIVQDTQVGYSSSSFIPEIGLLNGYIYSNNGQLYMDLDRDDTGAKPVTIESISIRDSARFVDQDAALSFSGVVQDGSKEIRATLKLLQTGDAVDMDMIAEDVLISDGESFVKFDDLTYVALKASSAEPTSEWDYSVFDNYTIDSANPDEDTVDPVSVVLNNFSLSIIDTDGNALTFDADLAYSTDEIQNYTVAFNGKYSYAETTFNGIINASGNSAPDGSSVFEVGGSVTPNGFEPFSIAVVGSIVPVGVEMDPLINGYALYTKGDYKLGFSLETVYESTTSLYTTTWKFADSNGVVSEIVDNYFSDTYASTDGTCYVSGIDSSEIVIDCDAMTEYENENQSIILTDKDGNTLAEMGEDSTGNSWEVIYSDDSTETIF